MCVGLDVDVNVGTTVGKGVSGDGVGSWVGGIVDGAAVGLMLGGTVEAAVSVGTKEFEDGEMFETASDIASVI